MSIYDKLRRSLSEVQQPLSKGEQNFKAMHDPKHVNLVPGITDQEHVFKGTSQRKDPKTASYENGESEQAYDKGLTSEALGTIKNMKAATKFSRDNISRMDREERQRKEREAQLNRRNVILSGAIKTGMTGKTIKGGVSTREEVEQFDEIFKSNYTATSEPSKFKAGGHRPKVINHEKGTTMYLGATAYSSPEHAKGHAKAYLDGYAQHGDAYANRAASQYQKANAKHVKEEIDEIDEARKSDKYLGTYKSPEEGKEILSKSPHGAKNIRFRARLGKDNPNKALYGKGGPLKRMSSQDIKPEHGTRFDAYSRKNEEIEQVDEAGAFSYGMKSPKKNSSAWHAQQMAKKDKTPPIEPKDQKIGVAKVTREEAEQVDEAVNPIEVASNPEMYETDTLKKAYYHKKANEDDKKILARHLDRRYGVRNWRKSMKEEAEQIDELSKETLGSYVKAAKADQIDKVGKEGKHYAGKRVDYQNREKGIDTAIKKLTGQAKVAAEEVDVSKGLGDTIFDFVHSKNPKFAGKSKKERMKQAMAAYYSKQRNEAYVDQDADWEGQMAKTELSAISDKASKLISMINDSDDLEAWVQSKISYAKTQLDGVYDYMTYGGEHKSAKQPDYNQSGQMASSYGNFMNRMGEEVVLESSDEDDEDKRTGASKNIINLLRKRPQGDHIQGVRFTEGPKADVHVKHANKVLSMHLNAKTADEKEAIQSQAGKSHEALKRLATSGKPDPTPKKSKVSLGGSMKEELKGDQHKIDANHNGKVDKMDFKLLRKRKKVHEAEEMTAANVAKAAATQTQFGVVGNRNMQQDSVDKIKQDPLASKEKVTLPPTQGNKPIGGDTQTHPNVAEEILLNKLYDSLSEQNKAKFDKMLDSEEGIEQLLNFAREQGL
ncbi:hypothetical protein UFOVP247_141 [uncultured Caudovirales phage]|uniref:EF-hand domain-containing protein n=1 Tax=uncultured Caudovirales phage TaxID=2100421 RepID=A0A6J7WU88_9CAUD|nr:hypothetical protein UFOVP247_141 [uncultured Caudovirales phage]